MKIDIYVIWLYGIDYEIINILLWGLGGLLTPETLEFLGLFYNMFILKSPKASPLFPPKKSPKSPRFV